LKEQARLKRWSEREIFSNHIQLIIALKGFLFRARPQSSPLLYRNDIFLFDDDFSYTDKWGVSPILF